MRSVSSWIRRHRKDFGSRDRVVLVVRKWVPPTFSFIHCPPFGTDATSAELLGSLLKALASVAAAAAVPLVNGVWSSSPATWLVWELLLLELRLLLSGVEGLPRLILVWTLLPLPPQEQLFKFEFELTVGTTGTSSGSGIWAAVGLAKVVTVVISLIFAIAIVRVFRSCHRL